MSFEPHVVFQYPELSNSPPANDPLPVDNTFDKREVYLRAVDFAINMMAWSRTARCGRLRLDCARFIMNGTPRPEAIAKRHKVSTRRVFQAIREVKFHCGLLKEAQLLSVAISLRPLG